MKRKISIIILILIFLVGIFFLCIKYTHIDEVNSNKNDNIAFKSLCCYTKTCK